MKLNEPYLIISLNDNKFFFFVISFNINKDYKLIKNVIIDSEGIQNGKIIDNDGNLEEPSDRFKDLYFL